MKCCGNANAQIRDDVCIIHSTLNQRLKLLGALALLVSLAFPIARGCTPVRYEGAQGNPVSPDSTGTLPQGVRVIQNYKYVFEPFRPTETEDWLSLSVFVWPIIVLGILVWKKEGRLVLGLRILEPLLIGWSTWAVYFTSTFLVKMASGAYIGFAALAIYAVGALWQDISVFREWRKAR
jgi:hypothetical protein